MNVPIKRTMVSAPTTEEEGYRFFLQLEGVLRKFAGNHMGDCALGSIPSCTCGSSMAARLLREMEVDSDIMRAIERVRQTEQPTPVLPERTLPDTPQRGLSHH